MIETILDRTVTQIRDGEAYKGDIQIGETLLQYEFVFSKHISALSRVEPSKEAIVSLFQITITKDGETIELSEEDHFFFFSLIFPVAMEFYHDPQIRGLDEGPFGELYSGRTFQQCPDAQGSIARNFEGTISLPPELVKRLEDQKFGCVLTPV